MYTLRLFQTGDLTQQVDARHIAEGELSVGRDYEADWIVADPDREISRRHCVFAAKDGVLTIKDVSANGTFVGSDGQRTPLGKAVKLSRGDCIRLGGYVINVESAPMSASEEAPPFVWLPEQANDATQTFLPVKAESTRGPLVAANDSLSEVSLLNAFCEGAGIDPSTFSDEDIVDVMRRVGSFYREAIFGVSELMIERSSAKTDYDLERTTVGAVGNNPFKWAPPHRLTVDLLRKSDSGFLSAGPAVKASVEDLRRHLVSMTSGVRAALGTALESLAPASIKGAIETQGFSIKSKAEMCWSEYERRFETLSRHEGFQTGDVLSNEFRRAYDGMRQAEPK